MVHGPAGRETLVIDSHSWQESRAPGGAPELSKQFHSVIAWVRPPRDDPQLRSLPDTFQDPITGATCRILVRTRLPHGLQQFHARQLLTAGTAAAQSAAEQQPLATPTGTEDQEMQEASPPQQVHNPAEAMDLETPAEADPPPQQSQQQEAHQQPRRTQQQAPQQQEPTRQEPQQQDQRQQQQQQHHQVWCNLAEQAQHLLETLERPWTEQEQLALASAYMLAFERSSLVPPCTEREWLLAHYQLPAASNDYADGYAEESSSQRRYPARGNRGLPANPWFEAAPTSAAPQANPPTEPTGARGRHGRKSVIKRRAFFQYLAQVQADIVVVQETHCSGDNQAQQWVQRGGGPGSAWQGSTFWQHHTSSSRGVGILLKAVLLPPDCHPVVEYRDDQATEPGRLLRVGWALPGNQHLSVVAVYAPCEAASRPAFFAEAFADAVLQPQFQHSHLIVAGDFNCVLEQRDVQPTLGQPAGNSSRVQGAQDMRLVCQAAALQDAWRTLHPAQCDYTHHSAGQHASAGRIDAVWVSQDPFDAGWVTKVQHLHDAPIGDHATVLLELQQPDTPPLGPGRWIFPNDLLGLETALADLKAAVEQYKQTWQPHGGPHGGVLPIEVQRWEDLKAYIQQYCVAEQKGLRQQRQQDRMQLAQQLRTARRLQHMFPIPATTAGLLAAKRALQLHEQAQAASRARCQEVVHDVYGEASTYYFHRLGKPPPEPQLITEVANPAQPGSTVSLSAPGGTQQAATIFADYYDAATGGLFTVHPTTAADQQLLLAAVDSQLSPEEQRQCLGALPDGSIQEDEAEAALRSLPRGKAPGSDGLTYEFYAALWSEVGDWMIAAFNQRPYLHGPQQQPQLSASQRLGLIVLIYKGSGQHRADPNSYRPITLLNCDVKIVAKVQVLRLGSVLPSVIDPTQTAFVPGRQIADNVLYHLEEVDYLQQERQPGVILFLDFAKAYDRLNRTWIQLCMQRMGFPPGSIRWVQLL
eukprot:gene15037-biopygen719